MVLSVILSKLLISELPSYVIMTTKKSETVYNPHFCCWCTHVQQGRTEAAGGKSGLGSAGCRYSADRHAEAEEGA